MTPEHLEALLWERLDGIISADDRVNLENHLAENGAAEKLAEELVDLNDLLVTIPPVPCPTGLRAAIDRDLAGARPARSTMTQSAVAHRRVTESWRRRLLPLAAGLLIGAAVVQLLHMGAADLVRDSSVQGTMIATPIQDAAFVVEIELGPGVGSVKAVCNESVVTIDAVLLGPNELQLVLEASDGDLELVGMNQTETRSSQLQSFENRLVLVADGPGSHRLAAETAIDSTQTRLTVILDQQIVAERWLEMADKESQR